MKLPGPNFFSRVGSRYGPVAAKNDHKDAISAVGRASRAPATTLGRSSGPEFWKQIFGS
jgi:hypothetical protein